MAYVEGLLDNYRRQLSHELSARASAAERVWFTVYPSAQERRVRSRLGEFEIATRQAGYHWHLVDLTDPFGKWLAGLEYREAYFNSPEDLAMALDEFGAQLVDSLIYTYLGADLRLAAAKTLKEKLEAILAGEKPFDIYVRWKPLHEQPIGWEPDLNDGVWLNIRPFVTAGLLRSKFTINQNKDRGTDPKPNASGTTERLNDGHFALEQKRQARQSEGDGIAGQRPTDFLRHEVEIMTSLLFNQARQYLAKALDNPKADFRDGQWEAIRPLVQDRAKLLVVQRTGWGKSIIYFLATRLMRDQGAGPTLLVSPLLALMRNQIEAAERIGVRAASLNSSNTDDWPLVEQELLAGQIDILLLSPERLANDDFRERVLSRIASRIGMLVVDEAHCISDWGHDFRPDYKRIVRIIQAMPANVPILGTTATANNRVVADVVEQLGDGLKIVRGPLARESLRLQNVYLPTQAERMAWLAARLRELDGSGIIYTRTIRDADQVAAWLRLKGFEVDAYHSEAESERRIELENALLANRVKALVATSALGMGFDKSDLAFVVHYQRPGSVVEYYQQVGRAGRGIKNASGIMLSGDEDDEITDYFIRTAFPPEVHVEAILAALDDAETGLSPTDIEQVVNLRRGQIEKALKVLAVMNPSPVVKQSGRWYRTPVPYERDDEKIARLIAIRKAEQAEMRRYLQSETCLMQFLRSALDDPIAQACGRCAVCVGTALLSEECPPSLVHEANLFLRRSDRPIEPRRQFPDKHTSLTGKRTIDQHLQAAEGRALSRWGDGGWSRLAQSGKFRDNHLPDELVEATAEMITERWKPSPYPTWIAAVPSRRNPALVKSFAERLAARLELPFIDCIEKIRDTKPQKEMHNSYQQYLNIRDVFSIAPQFPRGESVFLIDDMVDSRWTFTVLGVLLRLQGSGSVYPVALAETAANS